MPRQSRTRGGRTLNRCCLKISNIATRTCEVDNPPQTISHDGDHCGYDGGNDNHGGGDDDDDVDTSANVLQNLPRGSQGAVNESR